MVYGNLLVKKKLWKSEINLFLNDQLGFIQRY